MAYVSLCRELDKAFLSHVQYTYVKQLSLAMDCLLLSYVYVSRDGILHVIGDFIDIV